MMFVIRVYNVCVISGSRHYGSYSEQIQCTKMLKTFSFWLFILSLGCVRCKPDYMFNMDVNGWLKVHTVPAPWEEAFLRCHYEGAVLASPLTQQMSKTLENKFPANGQSIHLGTHDFYSKGVYFSVEGVPIESLVLKWKDVGSSGDCLAMSRDGQAFFTKCVEPRPYICYKKLENLTMSICGTFDEAYKFNDKTGSCYKTHLERQTWPDAYKICAAEGGHLVILNDAVEAGIVREMLPAGRHEWDNFHVGLMAWGPQRTWVTIHGERIEDVFNNWNPGQPDNFKGVQDTGSLIRLGTLDDHSRDTKTMFVCEKDPKVKLFEELPEGFAEFLVQ